ncbi:MAG: helix-hairpin-helix domain-containing protein [Thiotrichales bacterium]
MNALLFQALLLILLAFGLGLLIGWLIKRTFCQFRFAHAGAAGTPSMSPRNGRTLTGGKTGSFEGAGGAEETALAEAPVHDDPAKTDANEIETFSEPSDTADGVVSDVSRGGVTGTMEYTASLVADKDKSAAQGSSVDASVAKAAPLEKAEEDDPELTARDEELIAALQAELNGGNGEKNADDSENNLAAEETTSTHKPVTLEEVTSKASLERSSDQMEQLSLDDLEEAQVAAVSRKSAEADIAASAGTGFHGIEPDNLEIIEGIGPKMQSILYENGIATWSDLAACSEADLKQMLGKYGGRYQIIDPSEWIAQAELAAAGKPDELIALQKRDGVSKLERMLDSGVNSGFGRYKKNDLKIVEGIGPKIEELLKAEGINTWQALAQTAPDKIRAILHDAGPRYRLADPTTWPEQAALADRAAWDALKQFQSTLKGGRK